MTITTNFEIGDEVWYFKDGIPTNSVVKEIQIDVKMNKVFIKYMVLRDRNYLQESIFYKDQRELYGSLE